MTPAATTPAAHKASPKHRRARQSARPTVPRRVSGPLGGRAATASGARAATVPGVALPRRSAHRSRAVAARLRAGAFIRSLPDHRLLDRLIRGRWWIPVLGVMLAGIVAMQVEVLKLGASMGRSLERNSVLSSRNAALRQSVATLGDDQRIEQLAASMGMVMAPPQAVAFLGVHHDGDAAQAVANIHQPSATSFESMTPANGEILTASTLAAANAPSGTTGSTSTIGSTPTSTSSTSTSTSAASTAGTGPVAAAPTTSSSASGSTAATPTAAGPTAATPTAVTPSPTTSSGATSSSAASSQSPTTAGTTGPSTGAAGIAPPSTSSGGG